MKSRMNGKRHDMAYDPVGTDFDSAETAEEPSELIPSNNNGFSHKEQAVLIQSVKMSPLQCRGTLSQRFSINFLKCQCFIFCHLFQFTC